MHGTKIKLKFKVAELIDILKKNWKQHALDYTEAMVEFNTEYYKRLKDMMELADKNEFNQHVDVPQPVSYEKDYKRAVDMLELSCDEIIELDEATYDKLVNDNWSWKSHFDANTTMYLAKNK